MEHHRITVHRLIALLPLILLGGCNATESNSAASPYPVYDSGMWAEPTAYADIYWIDNNRVIFRSARGKDKRPLAGESFDLTVWEIGKGTTMYANDVVPVQGPLGRFCYNSEGTIFYPLKQRDAQGNELYKYGELGRERLFARSSDAKTVFDKMNCRVLDVDTMMKERKGRALDLLLTRHGYLELGPNGIGSSENIPVTLHRADGSIIQLPVRRQELGLAYRYHPFKDAYFFQGSLEPGRPSDIAKLWPPGTRQIFYWLHPDGRIEPVVLPPADAWPDQEHPGRVTPLHDGFFFRHGHLKRGKERDTGGGYLMRNGKAIRVVTGHLQSVTVSPDGCKVAFVHYPYADATLVADPAPIRLKAVDLCTERSIKSRTQ